VEGSEKFSTCRNEFVEESKGAFSKKIKFVKCTYHNGNVILRSGL
jgi:hypothetical protein